MNKILSNGFFLLRSPLLPYQTIEKLGEDDLKELINCNPLLREAIFLSSPDFYDRLMLWSEGKCTHSTGIKILETLRKYVSRMSYRCTPFGISAGISPGKFNEISKVSFCSSGSEKRFCRLDMTFLSRYTEELLKDQHFHRALRYFSNNTIYSTDNHLRYLEYKSIGNGRSHELVSLDQTEYLNKVIGFAKSGAGYVQICDLLIDDDVDIETARNYLDELIGARILVSELELSPEGDDDLQRLFAVMENSGHPQATTIKRIIAKLDKINGSVLNAINGVENYKELIAEVESLGIDIDKRFLIQVDMSRDFKELQVSNAVTNELFTALSFLERIKQRPERSELDRFTTAFFERYESEEIPLLEALDPEIGIGYPYREGYTADNSELISGIASSSNEGYPNLLWTPWQKRLLEKYSSAIQKGDQVIKLLPADITGNGGNGLKLPRSAYSVCKLFAASPESMSSGDFKVLHVLTGGPSAVDLISRFCYMDEQLTQDARAALAVERQDSENIYAEILHINQPRAGNISKHPRFYDYNIPIIASNINEGEAIRLDDLMLSIVGGKIYLRSKTNNKRVVPRLSTAHNYTQNTISYYRFLCDLQYNGSSGDLYWDWGFLSGMPFLPRIEYGKTILSRASWALDSLELSAIRIARQNGTKGLSDIFNKIGVPRYVTIREADYEMPIDLHDVNSLDILLKLTENKSSVRLEENLFHNNGFVLSKGVSSYTNDVVIPFSVPRINDGPIFERSPIKPNQRHFTPGSEWMYLKLYCSPKFSNKLLNRVILPLCRSMLESGIIDQWFFIRYNDPGYHLRLRIHLSGDYNNEVLRAVNESLEAYVKSGKIRPFKLDSYIRELERYSLGEIQDSEKLFFEDSRLVAEFLGTGKKEWIFAIKGVDKLLEDFGISLKQRIDLTSYWQQAFKDEFGITKIQIESFKLKYRSLKPEIEALLGNPPADRDNDIFEPRSQQIRRLLINIDDQTKIAQQVNSYVHMFLNRLFMVNQRKKEMVVYDLLHQYYKAKFTKEKYLVLK